MDEKDAEIMRLEAQVEAQQAYYVELLDLKDLRIHILEGAVKDALGSPTKGFLDKLSWTLVGYGFGRMDE